MLNFEEYRLSENTEFDLIQGLQSVGMGFLIGTLGAKGLNIVQNKLYRSGYGKGREAFLRFAKELIGKNPYETYKYTDEEKQKLETRLKQIVDSDNNSNGNKIDFVKDKTEDFANKLFDLNKVTNKAKIALQNIVENIFTYPDQTAISTVLSTLAKGAGSDYFKSWYKERISKPEITKIGRGKNKKPLLDDEGKPIIINYSDKSEAMNKVNFTHIKAFYIHLYKPFMKSADTSPQVTPKYSEPTDSEKQAKAHDLNRTAQALRNIRSEV